jgi:lysophospholipase L1-like esterase
MKRQLAATVAAMLLSACGGGDQNSEPSPTAPPAATTTPRSDYALLVLIGDSITYLWNDPAWVTDAADLISSHYPNVIDAGVGGQTTKQMWERFDTDVLAYHPGIIEIDGGTNDVALLNSSDTQYLFDMIDAAQTSGALVIVGTLPPDTYHIDYTIDQATHAAWNAAIRAGARVYGYRIADYYSAMLLPDGQQNPALFYSDGTHPINAGYAVMWDVLEPQLRLVAPATTIP